MHGLQRIDIKVLATSGQDIDPFDFVKVFQRWIQDHTVPGVLIDVADYSHMHHGPGVILVGHEKNISIDYTDGRMGLLYHRKQPSDGLFPVRLREALRSALKTCVELESEASFQGRLRFDGGKVLVIANDRLHTPNNDAIGKLLRDQALGSFGATMGPDAAFNFRADDRRNRVVVEIQAARALPVQSALNGLEAQEVG